MRIKEDQTNGASPAAGSIAGSATHRPGTVAREIAFALLCERERTNGDITELCKAAMRSSGGTPYSSEKNSPRGAKEIAGSAASLSVRNRALVRQLAVGTVEHLITLDAVINRIASVKTTSMKVAVRNVLRMGTFQILFLSGIPAHAAVDESVRLIRPRTSVKIAGFVNAVLRRISREKKDILAHLSSPDTPVGERYSMPPYLCRLFEKERGPEETERIFAALCARRDLCIRPDPRLVADPEKLRAWEAELAEALSGDISPAPDDTGDGSFSGEASSDTVSDDGSFSGEASSDAAPFTRHPLLPQVLLLKDPGDVTKLPGYADGAFVVQDAAGVLAVDAAGIRPTDRVLDVCAAPGGKALYAAALVNDPAQVIARDVSEDKCAILKENAQRLRLSGMQIQTFDATVFDPSLEGVMDVVLCDLPCSGFGVMGRKPEIRYHASAAKTDSLVQLQRQILDTAWHYVRPGGILLYSTCTLSLAENEDNVAWFTAEYPFATEPWLDAHVPGALRGAVKNGCLTLLPGVYGTDGFFITRMRRQA